MSGETEKDAVDLVEPAKKIKLILADWKRFTFWVPLEKSLFSIFCFSRRIGRNLQDG